MKGIIAKEEVPVLKIDLTKWKGIPIQLIAGTYKHSNINSSYIGYWIKYKWGNYISKESEVFFNRPGYYNFSSSKELMNFINNETNIIENELRKFKVSPSNHIEHL